ncbi:MAG: ferritin-like domain-containing protein [Chloroflexota bacterium]|nr:ferritin-like domain-containing protein [Chloroflexota bacterium]
MALGKEFIVGELRAALAAERIVVESERALAQRTGDPRLRELLESMVSGDEGHLASYERVLASMGARPDASPLPAASPITTLGTAARDGTSELESLNTQLLLKQRTVLAGEVFRAIAKGLGQPKFMKPLGAALREDKEHAKELRKLLIRRARALAIGDADTVETAREAEVMAPGPSRDGDSTAGRR